MALLHRAYYPQGERYIYWSAPNYDGAGNSYQAGGDNPPFGDLVNITILSVPTGGGSDPDYGLIFTQTPQQ